MGRRAKSVDEYLRPRAAGTLALALPRCARILGIDPGSRLCGWAVLEQQGAKLSALGYGVIKTGDGSLAARLARLHGALTAVIAQFGPAEAAVEQVFVRINPATALILGQARGVALLALGQAGLDPAEYLPTLVKRSVVGHGRADKQQIQQMVRMLLKLDEAPPSDAADAIAVAICHAHSRTAPR